METAGIAKLKASLSRYLARVQAGEEILITTRGRAIAKIVPVRCDVDLFPERLLDMERAGLIRLGTGKLPDGFWDLPRPEDPDDLALKALLAEREEGR
jgi:prevent-host-death family protein